MEKKQRVRHHKVTVTAVTLLKRMLIFIEETARCVAPSKATAFDTLAFYVRIRTNTYFYRIARATEIASPIMPSQDCLSFFDGCPVTTDHRLFFKLLERGFCRAACQETQHDEDYGLHFPSDNRVSRMFLIAGNLFNHLVQHLNLMIRYRPGACNNRRCQTVPQHIFCSDRPCNPAQ